MWPDFMPGNLDRNNKKEWNPFENESSNDLFGSRGGSPIDRFNREKRDQFGNHIPEDDEWDRIREESGMPQDIAKRDKPKKNRPKVTKEDAEKFWADHPNFFLISAIFEIFIPGPSEFAKFAKLGISSKGVQAIKSGTQFMRYQGNFVLKSSWKNWGNYMSSRGWTFDDIQQTLLKGNWSPHTGTNYLNPGNSMSIVNNTNGKSLIIDNVTKEIIQLGGQGFKY